MIWAQRLFAWGLLALLLSASYMFVVRDDLAAIDEARQVYLRKAALLSRLENLPKREEQIKRQLADLGNEEANQFLYQEDHRATQVLMQRDIRAVASHAKLSISSMRSLNKRSEDTRLLRSTVQLNFATTHETLTEFLLHLNDTQPILKVDRMTIKTQRASTENQAAILAVMLEVSGLRDRHNSGASS